MSLILACTLAACASQPPAKLTLLPIDVSGVWQINAAFTVGSRWTYDILGRVRPQCVFEQSGEKFTGTCKEPGSEGTVEGTVEGNHIQFVWTHYPRPHPVNTYIVDGRDVGGPGRDAQGHSTSRIMFAGNIEQKGLIKGSVSNMEFPKSDGLFRAARL